MKTALFNRAGQYGISTKTFETFRPISFRKSPELMSVQGWILETEARPLLLWLLPAI